MDGDLPGAAEEYRRALAVAPGDADTLAFLAASFALVAGDPREGAELGRRALDLNPVAPLWYFSALGRAEYVRGDYRASIAALCQAPPAAPATLAFLAMAHARLGEAEEARRIATRLGTLFPELHGRGLCPSLPGDLPARPCGDPGGRSRGRASAIGRLIGIVRERVARSKASPGNLEEPQGTGTAPRPAPEPAGRTVARRSGAGDRSAGPPHDEPEAEQAGGEQVETEHDVEAALVAHREPPESGESGQRALHDPAVAAQALGASTPRRAIRGVMPRLRQARRQRA